MSRLSIEDQEKVRNAINNNPHKGDKEIANELGVPTQTVVKLRRGIKIKAKFGKIDEKVRASVRKLIKLGKDNQHIANELDIKIEHVELIRKRIAPSKHRQIKTFHNKYNKIELDAMIDINHIKEIFIKTGLSLCEKPDRSNYLLFRYKYSTGYCPRELEAQHIISNLLSEYKYFHMIESPIDDSDTLGFIDLSIFDEHRVRLVDIELKEEKTGADRDFPKLFKSPTIGAAVFFISNHADIEKVLPDIIATYKEAYYRILNEMTDKLIKDKWFLFFLVSCKEGRMFYSFCESIKTVDFDKILNNEIK